MVEKFNIQVPDGKIPIIRINDTQLTTKTNDIALTIIDTSYCGDYYEVMLAYENHKESTLLVRMQASNFLKVGQTMYLDINPEKIMLIDK